MKDETTMLPMLTFRPLLKQTIWGGDKIAAMKHIDIDCSHVGESWEVSGVKDNESVVDGGPLDGCRLNDLVARHKDALVGHDNYGRFGDEFPLLVKFIDARNDLSIQVHPDDATARRQGRERGKTEMWYAMKSEPGAQLFNGLSRNITPAEYEQMVANDTITQALARHDVAEGDVFFIPAGRIHAIGAGCFVAEIQQTSDVTYRIYDYNRRDSEGNLRQLHTRLAAESIDYTVMADYRTHYRRTLNEPQTVVECPFFTTSVYDLDQPMELDYSELDSFVILVGVGGSGVLSMGRQHVEIGTGRTVLVPATAKRVKVEGTVRFLETFV